MLLGGTSFVGGVGTMFGTFLGVLFLGVLQNGLIISSISIYYQNVITGAVLVLSRADRPLPPVTARPAPAEAPASSVPRRRAVAASSTVQVSGSIATP